MTLRRNGVCSIIVLILFWAAIAANARDDIKVSSRPVPGAPQFGAVINVDMTEPHKYAAWASDGEHALIDASIERFTNLFRDSVHWTQHHLDDFVEHLFTVVVNDAYTPTREGAERLIKLNPDIALCIFMSKFKTADAPLKTLLASHRAAVTANGYDADATAALVNGGDGSDAAGVHPFRGDVGVAWKAQMLVSPYTAPLDTANTFATSELWAADRAISCYWFAAYIRGYNSALATQRGHDNLVAMLQPTRFRPFSVFDERIAAVFCM
jgi:hypothetical protein